MKIIGKLGVATICFWFALSSVAIAEPYAPLLDASTATNPGDRYLKYKFRSVDMPSKEEVPVAAYSPASVFATRKIPSSGEGKYQENRIVKLVTTKPEQSVLDFYKSKLSGWNYKELKTSKVFLEKGEQYRWGGRKILQAPRVEVIDISDDAQSASGDALKLKESFPGMKTIIKVYYEKSSSPQVAVDVSKVVNGCIDFEVESKKKMLGDVARGPQIPSYLRKQAESSCKRVQKACAKGVNDRFCQKYARKYN